MFSLAAILGLISFFRKTRALKWAQAGILSTIILWFFQIVLGLIASKLVWGVIAIDEPRNSKMVIIVLPSAVGLYVLTWAAEISWLKSLAAVLIGVEVWVGLVPYKACYASRRSHF